LQDMGLMEMAADIRVEVVMEAGVEEVVVESTQRS
jgi:hypothetical protein